MKFCGYCGENIDDNAEFCPYCGEKADNKAEQKKEILKEIS